MAISRSEMRKQQRRRNLKPVSPDERPFSLKIATLLATAIGTINLCAFAFGVEIAGNKPHLIQVLIPTVLMLSLAWGMWQKRYWAVLIFQALLVMLIIYLSIMLTFASNLIAVGTVLVVVFPAGYLFWKLVRTLARLQMPQSSE